MSRFRISLIAFWAALGFYNLLNGNTGGLSYALLWSALMLELITNTKGE